MAATMVEGVRAGLRTAMAENERVVLLGEDVGSLGGVFRASDGLLEEFGADRVVDTPMAELSIVGVSLGLALRGMRPVAEIQFADFIYAAADQIISEAARYRFRTAGTWQVPLVIRAPWGAGIHGALYHSQSIEAVFAHFPGLKVVAASTPRDAAGLLLSAIDDPDPVLVLEHKLAYRRARGELSDPPERVEIGPARVAREGSDVSVIAYGWMVHEALEAAERLAQEGGPGVEVVDLRTLSPLDRDTITASASKTGRVCVVHEDMRSVGMGAEVSATITERCFGDLAAPVARLTMPDVAGTPYADGLEAALIPDAERIAAVVRELAASGPRIRHQGIAVASPPEDEPRRRHRDAGVPQASMTMTAAIRDAGAVTPRLIAAVAQALVDEPAANGVFTEDGIHLNPAIHLELIEPADGPARARRILVPHAEELSPFGIERHLRRGRTGDEPQPEISPTVTLILAGHGTLFGMPRVPPGQTAAIQAGMVHDAVVATGRGVEVQRQVHLTVSADHRVLDGAGSASLLAAIKRHLEAGP
jgi:2-oxoisovalerate dehydrogenase E1 component beta subunit